VIEPTLEEALDLIDAGDFEGALTKLRAIDPEQLEEEDRVEYTRSVAQCLSQTGQFEDAEKTLQQALKTLPGDTTLLCELGIVLSESGREEQARRHFEHLLTLAPQDPSVAYNYGAVLEKLHQMEDAAAQYRAALKLDESFDWAWLRLAECLASLEKDEEAVRAYEEYLGRRADDGDAWIGLAALHRDSGRFDEASRCFEQAEATEADRESLYYEWIVSDLRRSDAAAATARLKQLADANPRGSRRFFAEAFIAQAQGDLEMVRLRAWQGAGRSLNEDWDNALDGFADAMRIFEENRWPKDAVRLFDQAVQSDILEEDLLRSYNAIQSPMQGKGIWVAMTLSARPAADPECRTRYSRAFEVEAPNLRAAKLMALRLEKRLGGRAVRVEQTGQPSEVKDYHPGVVWADDPRWEDGHGPSPF